MRKALDHRGPPRSNHAPPPLLASTDALLVQGGDARLALDPSDGLNRYGCPPSPVTHGLHFASSTASIISGPAYRAADALRRRLARACAREADGVVYARELDALRAELLVLNRLDDVRGLEIAFAASGTDLHLIVAELVGGEPDNPLLCLAVEAEETGSGVHWALCGRHFSDRAALGEAVAPGESIGVPSSEFVAVPARGPDGALRAGADIETALDALVLAASRAGRRALLTVAGQFRLSPATLRAYLAAGLMVAVTGSKFLTGPTFSGALFIPDQVAERLKGRLLKSGFGLYSARAEWPAGWVAGAALPQVANFGLLMRWRAAMVELAALRALPETQVAAFLGAFADAVEARLAVDPMFEPVATRVLDRRAIGARQGWDTIPTIFAFRLRAASSCDAGFLGAAQVQEVYQQLGRAGVRLGQPVSCGVDGGALRLCASARLVVQALAEGAAGAEAVIADAMAALDAAADAAREQG
jgi:hypothetical protein